MSSFLNPKCTNQLTFPTHLNEKVRVGTVCSRLEEQSIAQLVGRIHGDIRRGSKGNLPFTMPGGDMESEATSFYLEDSSVVKG